MLGLGVGGEIEEGEDGYRGQDQEGGREGEEGEGEILWRAIVLLDALASDAVGLPASCFSSSSLSLSASSGYHWCVPSFSLPLLGLLD